jgi:hypothetical protein
MADRLDDVWTTRDRPVLVEVVRRFDDEDRPVSHLEVAEAVGLSGTDVVRAALNLERAGLVEVDRSLSGDVSFDGISVDELRITGLWPDAGDVVDRLLWSLEQRISEAPPEERGKLVKFRDAVGGMGRDVLVEVLGAAVTGRLPL